MPSLKERIQDILLSRRLVTREQLDEVLAQQQEQGGSLQKLLIDRGLVKESDLLSAISQGLGIPPISLTKMKIDASLRTLIPRDLAMQYQLIPVSCIGQTLTVAMADPLNIFALDMLTGLTGLSINPLLTTSADIRDAVDQYYGTGVEETLREITQKAEADAVQVVNEAKIDDANAEQLLSLTQEAPVVKITDALLERAVRIRASDLLIEPMEKKLRTRYRVDGVFQEGQSPPKPLQAAIISRIKIMSELNIAEHRVPQDGHCTITVEGRTVDFRVSILPSVLGEKACLRVLDKGTIRLDLDTFGFRPQDLERLKRCAQRPHGLLLSTGPTGSGKTTSLYALLKYVDHPTKNIVTVEDPVEFELEGINQVSAKTEIGLTFASALRSILRQDPDIIMVVVGQRLVRRICRGCLEVYQPPQGIADRLGLVDNQGKPLPLARGTGCGRCLKSGYAGREIIAEVLLMTPEVRELVLRRASEKEIESAAKKDGMEKMREHGLEKAVAHLTTLEEVFRTTTGDTVPT